MPVSGKGEIRNPRWKCPTCQSGWPTVESLTNHWKTCKDERAEALTLAETKGRKT